MNPLPALVEPAAAAEFAALAAPLVPTKTLLLSGADPEAKRAELRRYFHQTCELYERLFALVREDASYYERHEPLRHPLIFYYGHPAVFYVNKLTAGRLIQARIDPR
ncbi:MAG: SAM-dependent methyltransferase, partial [Planctomycetia bacterium]|nr:SAM-dependent methyltransferase [Planctomycetia bacterium]